MFGGPGEPSWPIRLRWQSNALGLQRHERPRRRHSRQRASSRTTRQKKTWASPSTRISGAASFTRGVTFHASRNGDRCPMAAPSSLSFQAPMAACTGLRRSRGGRADARHPHSSSDLSVAALVRAAASRVDLKGPAGGMFWRAVERPPVSGDRMLPERGRAPQTRDNTQLAPRSMMCLGCVEQEGTIRCRKSLPTATT